MRSTMTQRELSFFGRDWQAKVPKLQHSVLFCFFLKTVACQEGRSWFLPLTFVVRFSFCQVSIEYFIIPAQPINSTCLFVLILRI